ncbi:DUF6456 domain-containing protein [Maricaulis sp.]|uniref:DUF6456 domain-containing protein n=1 Tax=Maricaulis sp. TaxID=1486257 RepID=UPI00261E80FC|nr:DUF6456 domain-containing protein [Maricaulis sp.]
MSTPRWQRCLARDGAELWPLVRDANRFGVFAGGDRRRRPLAKLGRAALDEAIAAGQVEPDGEAYRLTQMGRATAIRASGGLEGFAGQHRQMVSRSLIDRAGRLTKVKINALESPLGRLATGLSPRQRQAGERFLADYHRSSLLAPVTRNWSADALARAPGRAGGQAETSLTRIRAKDRVMRALAAAGKRNEAVLMAALVREESLASLERRFGWKARSGRAVLAQALDALAWHYRLI